MVNEEWFLGAFVGDECRGVGQTLPSGLFHVAVAGVQGEQVSFRLCHKTSGQVVPLKGTVVYSGRAGSSRRPLRLTADAGLTEPAARLSLSFDGRHLMAAGATEPLRLTVYDAMGKTILAGAGPSLSLAALPGGVYVAKAVSGQQSAVIKIKK